MLLVDPPARIVLPVVGFCRNPLVGMRADDMRECALGVSLASLAPEDAEGLLVLRYNGEFLLRAEWIERTKPGDVVEFFDFPKDRESLRTILAVAILVASLASGQYQFAKLALPYLVAGSLAYNLLVPPRQPENSSLTPGSVYSTSLAGNAARIDQPIWVNYGHVKITPPFAAQPYFVYLPSDAANPTVDCDQYGYFLFALGIGEYDLVKAFIGKTPIGHFQDVLVAQILEPGEQPSQVLANVVTSGEVSGLELSTDANGDGVYAGGYVACRPGDTVSSIGVDIRAPQGLGYYNDSGAHALTIDWQVEVRQIDDFSAPTGEWQIVDNQSRTASTNTEQRWSTDITLAAPIRCEVRVIRTTAKITLPNARDSLEWAALRATLSRPATLNAETSHYEVVMRASKQLSGDSARDFSVLLNRKIPVWDPDSETWSANQVTRNAAWALCDVLRNPAIGEALSDERIDLPGMAAFAATLDARQDRFDFSFASSRDAWDALQTIARSGRGRVSRPFGIYTVARDELVSLPTAAFHVRNTQPGSIGQSVALPGRDQPDGVIVEFQHGRKWDTETVLCPCPGVDPDYVLNPVYIPLEGVIGPIQAEREGLYMAAKIALRGEKFPFETEMEGLLVRFLDTVKLQPEFTGYGQAGDVAFWDPDTRQMGLTEPADFGAGALYLVLTRDDGSLTTPVLVAPGTTPFDIVLPDLPDFDLVVNSGTRERPKYLLGTASGDELVKIESIEDGGKAGGAQLYKITAVIDDPRVHAADNALLPGPGVLQDPIDLGEEDNEIAGGTAALVRLSDHTISGGNVGLPDDTYRGGIVGFTMYADGRCAGFASFSLPSIGTPTVTVFPREWINTAPVETSVASLYEVFADDSGKFAFYAAAGATIVGTVGAWLPMTTDRTWSITAGDAEADVLFDPNDFNVPMVVSIRRIGSTVIQARRNINLVLTLGSSPP